MKKLIMFLTIVILLVGTISAFDFDNVKRYDEGLKEITIKNAFGLPFIGDNLATYKLTYNTDQCLINCRAEGTATLYADGYLFTDLRFKDAYGKDKSLKESNIYLLLNVTHTLSVPVYGKELCDVKNPFGGENQCRYEITGYRNKDIGIMEWVNYDGNILDKGNYIWKIEGKKNIDESIDWIGSSFGKDFTDWAWWSSSWTYKNCFDVTNNMAVAFTNFTFNRTMDTATPIGTGKMNADGSDIRIIADDETEMPFNFTNIDSADTMLYFKNITVGASAVMDVCVYYGNAGASDGTTAMRDVFLEYDNFNKATVDTTIWAQTGTLIGIDPVKYKLNLTSTANWDDNYLKSLRTFAYPIEVGFLSNWTSWDNSKYFNVFWGTGTLGTTTDGLKYYASGDGGAGYLYFFSYDNGGINNCNVLDGGYSAEIEGVSKMIANTTTCGGSHSSSNVYDDEDFTALDTSTARELQIGTQNLGDANLFQIDDFYVRRYASVAPSIGAFGGEETNINPLTITVTLDYPENGANINQLSQYFLANFTAEYGNVTNASLVIWNSLGVEYGKNITVDLNGATNSTNVSLTLVAGDNQKWNYYACAVNSTNNSECSWASSNRTFNVAPFSISSITYNNVTYETSRETFSAVVNMLEDSQISSAQLIYNGTSYSISDFSLAGTILTLSKSIDIPLLQYTFTNETRNFYFRFTYSSNNSVNTPTYIQNVTLINFQKCNTTFATQSLNFTFFNELDQTNINGTLNNTNFESSWKYWIGHGTVYKNYSFQNLTSTLNSYQFCVYPYYQNITYKIDGDIEYSATDFRENHYYLRNATITNVSNNILLYLISSSEATKFFLTFKQGVNLLSNSIVTVQKYFTGLGSYQTVSILSTDTDGKTTMWQEVDKQYKYYVVKNNQLLGTAERISSCSVAPCTMTITLESGTADVFESFYQTYAINVLSNLSFNKTTKIIKYEFIDTTGLANYFRLQVDEVRLNQSKNTVCNVQSYSVAGTLTCNLSGYSNSEFIARTYISRSPELTDLVLNVIISEDFIQGLGLSGVFIVIGILITLVFAGAMITKGSPSGILWVLAGSILGLKLIGFFPFSWAVVIPLEFIILYLISKVKT